MPLLLIMFIIFSISMNGDIDRGGLLFALDSEIPSEPGVAPFEARVTIFVTLLVLLILALVVACSNTHRSVNGDGVRREGVTRGGWEDAHGTRTARLARANLIRTSRWLLGDTSHHDGVNIPSGAVTRAEDGISRDTLARIHLVSPALPPPFNLLSLPLDIAVTLSRLIDKSDVESGRAYTFTRLRYVASVAIAGLLCLPFTIFGKKGCKQTSRGS